MVIANIYHFYRSNKGWPYLFTRYGVGYPEPMTIAARRRMYWALFIIACTCLTAFVPLYLSLVRQPAEPAFLVRSGAFTRFKFFGLGIPSQHLAGAGIGLCALYASLTLGLILYSFRKTVSAEIYFYAFWVLSLGFETLRLLVFGLAAGNGSQYWQIFATKALLFARYAGNLSLIASGVYAAGFRSERLGIVAVFIFAVAMALAASMPVNTGSFAATLELRAGYRALHASFYAVASLLTVASFFYAVRSTGERSYRFVALGCAAFLIGRQLLVSQLNPFVIVAGFALLITGSWLFISRLHAYYLWQ
jgi:hypothetical protein